jgi:hypothetical protein
MVSVTLPSTGRVNLLHFPEKNQYVVHLLYGPPIQRGIARVIEDLVTLHNIEVTLDVDQPVRTAYLVPGMHALPMQKNGTKITVVVPEFSCHTAVVFG